MFPGEYNPADLTIQPLGVCLKRRNFNAMHLTYESDRATKAAQLHFFIEAADDGGEVGIK